MKPDFSKGLLPAVIIDDTTNDVLMLGYMNEESYAKTLETKTTWFFSRSRNKLWNKGETSGHFQHVKEMYLDCDQDTLLVRVDQIGPACHTGSRTCFFTKVLQEEKKMTDILRALYETIVDRKNNPVAESYTNYLFTKGEDKILKKVGEEATEVLIAAKNNDKEELVYEIADLTFHCLVLLAEKGIALEDVKKELERRQGKLSKTADRKEIESLQAAKHQVPITVSSDSHYPDDIGSYVAQNVETLLRHGFTEIAAFEKRKRIMKPLGQSVLQRQGNNAIRELAVLV